MPHVGAGFSSWRPDETGVALLMNHLSPDEVSHLLSSVSGLSARMGCSFSDALRHLIALAESGDPVEIADFDAGKWLTDWMERPLPALGGSRPAEYMDTIEGQEMISRILAMMQSGAYA